MGLARSKLLHKELALPCFFLFDVIICTLHLCTATVIQIGVLIDEFLKGWTMISDHQLVHGELGKVIAPED
jgi:hypothetical protein